MIAKWNDDPEMGEVLSLRPGTAEEIEVLEKIRDKPELILEWYNAAGVRA